MISPFALRKIGESAARRYFVTGERFDAATALRIGLVHEVATDLEAALDALLAELRTAARARPGTRSGSCSTGPTGRDRAEDRRAAHERGGPGGAERVRRATAATLGAAAEPDA